MNEYVLSFLGVLMGILSTLGVMYLVEWVVTLRERCKDAPIKHIPPPEYDPKDVAFKSAPTPDQIIKGLKYIDDNEEYIERTQKTNHD